MFPASQKQSKTVNKRVTQIKYMVRKHTILRQNVQDISIQLHRTWVEQSGYLFFIFASLFALVNQVRYVFHYKLHILLQLRRGWISAQVRPSCIYIHWLRLHFLIVLVCKIWNQGNSIFLYVKVEKVWASLEWGCRDGQSCSGVELLRKWVLVLCSLCESRHTHVIRYSQVGRI